jgi:hypothetical protein
MAWATTRYKTFTSGGSFTPADANAIQDQYVRATGILADDLDAATLAVPLGLTTTAGATGGAAVRRGKSIIATEETLVTPVAYTLAATPDRVQNIVLPTDGFIVIAYHINIKSSVASAGFHTAFVGANQIQVAAPTTGNPVVSEAQNGSNGTLYQAGASGQSGPTVTNSGAGGYSGDVTTGQIVGTRHHAVEMGGGVMYVFAAAGTYDVSIKYKASSGNVTVKNRKLWVWTVGY